MHFLAQVEHKQASELAWRPDAVGVERLKMRDRNAKHVLAWYLYLNALEAACSLPPALPVLSCSEKRGLDAKLHLREGGGA